jgi:CheY-like chemotaxis protein/anti-sigma regulatory factor (Ser/Thr protein kinase)
MRARADMGNLHEREVIERQVRQMMRLVDDLLDVSRITRGTVALSCAPIELRELVATGLEIARPLVDEREHRVTVDVATGTVVHADAGRISQVIANLVMNAAKYTPRRGNIAVEARRDGECVVLRVRDDGVGIAPDMLARVFDPFVQGKQSIERAQGGLGLGLTIARSLVEAHGGTIAARSDGPGRGSEIIMTLPPGRAAPDVPATTEPLRPAPTPTRVLAVDDNEDALELLVEALQLLGYDVVGARDGESALAQARQHRPQVALLDLGLPVIDGYALAARLRALPGLADLRIVALTGYDQPSDRARTEAAGFSAHLVKPTSLDEIRRLLG